VQNPAHARREFGRYGLLAALLTLEGVVLGVRFDADSITHVGGVWWNSLLSYVNIVPQLVIAMATAAALIGGQKLLVELRRASRSSAPCRRVWPFLAAHAAALLAFTLLTGVIFEGSSAASPWIVASWAIAGLAVPASLIAAALPVSLALIMLRATRHLLGLAALVGTAAWTAGTLTANLWVPLRDGTLASVHGLLSVVTADALVRPNDFVVGTERFWVTIAPACSGYQGIGMIWVFVGVYLWTFRDSLRFPHALLLIPLATGAAWLANVARIAALVLVGSNLSPAVALGGFHSYVGSLLFSALALSLAWGCHRSHFCRAQAFGTQTTNVTLDATTRDSRTAAYLAPMLAILAAALLAGSMSTGAFDLLYPLRFLAVVVCIWIFRHAYHELRWTWSWQAIAAGVAVFALWLALEPATAQAQSVVLPSVLSQLPTGLACAWLAFRVLGSIVTVPLAEELAFRGYISRRVSSAEFTSIPLRRISWIGLIVSSLLFGAMHNRLVAGTIAGVVFGLVARRRGELSDAVLAHATANALLAVYVLSTGSWTLWG